MTALQQAAPPSRDSLQAVIDAVFTDPAYQWESRPNPLEPLGRLWGTLLDRLDRLRESNPAAFELVTWLLVAVLLAILAHAAWVALQTIRGRGRDADRRLHAAPPPVRDAAWYAAEARALAERGRYAEAMQAEFLRLMLQLDGRGVVRFRTSATPFEYVRTAALPEAGRAALRDLVRRMYNHAFAGVPCDRETFEGWRREATVERYAAAH